jgi:hypothetical protein
MLFMNDGPSLLLIRQRLLSSIQLLCFRSDWPGPVKSTPSRRIQQSCSLSRIEAIWSTLVCKKCCGNVAPSQETMNAVKAWLLSSSIELSRVKMPKSMNQLTYNATAHKAETLLKTEYHLYEHDAGHKYIAWEEYSLPSHLTEHIDIVTPTVNFDRRIGGPRRVDHHENLRRHGNVEQNCC